MTKKENFAWSRWYKLWSWESGKSNKHDKNWYKTTNTCWQSKFSKETTTPGIELCTNFQTETFSILSREVWSWKLIILQILPYPFQINFSWTLKNLSKVFPAKSHPLSLALLLVLLCKGQLKKIENKKFLVANFTSITIKRMCAVWNQCFSHIFFLLLLLFIYVLLEQSDKRACLSLRRTICKELVAKSLFCQTFYVRLFKLLPKQKNWLELLCFCWENYKLVASFHCFFDPAII